MCARPAFKLYYYFPISNPYSYMELLAMHMNPMVLLIAISNNSCNHIVLINQSHYLINIRLFTDLSIINNTIAIVKYNTPFILNHQSINPIQSTAIS